MQSIYNDHQLRAALHSIYVSQFLAIKNYAGGFNKNDATRMLTGLMGSRPWSWRVIGITREALDLFAAHDFERPPRLLQRGHKVDRATTAEELYMATDKPFSQDDFYAFFLERDKTVLMTNEQNKHRPGGTFPDFIPIDPTAQVFPCGSLVGWQHRKAEREFLRKLHATL